MSQTGRRMLSDEIPHPAGETEGLAKLAQAIRLSRAASGSSDRTDSDLPSKQHLSVEPVCAAHFQFRLRTMLGLVAAVSGLLAVMQVVGAVWSAILIWILLLIIVHVTANFWGTRVAPGSGRPAVEDQPVHRASDRPVAMAVGPVRLSESLRPGWPMFVVTGLGTLIGGVVGSIALMILSLDRAGYAGVIVGTVSAAAVGGFLGFLTSSFAAIALRAWNEAVCGAVSPPPGEREG